MNGALAYIPFVQPINAFHDWWYLLIIPLSFGIAVIYKAMRLATLERFWPQTALMTTQIVVYMAALAAGLVLLFQLLIPHLPVE